MVAIRKHDLLPQPPAARAMLRKLAAAVAVLLVALVGFAATRPDTFALERSIAIAAPPERIYPMIADLHAWRAWSPWEGLDPAMTRTFGGAPSGVGATYGWQGNSAVGAGTMTITAAVPSSRVAIDLAFLEPFAARNVTEFTLAPTAAGTQVTWAMRGPQPFLGKVMGVFLSPDAMVGPDFEKGLAALKREAERGS